MEHHLIREILAEGKLSGIKIADIKQLDGNEFAVVFFVDSVRYQDVAECDVTETQASLMQLWAGKNVVVDFGSFETAQDGQTKLHLTITAATVS